MASMFRGVIDFLGDLGIYDVVLPFLLVFTVTFAVLEKSKVFGIVKIDGIETTRKNLNSLVAFCLGFIAVASSKIVAIINEGLANVVLVMICIVSFMLLVGTMFGEKEDLFGEKTYKGIRAGLIIVSLIVTLMIFLNSIKTKDGVSWLSYSLSFIGNNWDSTLVASIVLLGLMFGFMFFIVRTPKKKEGEE
jgi:hypothetical protein